MDHRRLRRTALSALILLAGLIPVAEAATTAVEEFEGPPLDGWELDAAEVRDGALWVNENGRAMLPVGGGDVEVRVVVGRRGTGTAWVAYRWGGEDLALVRIGEPIEVLVEVGGEIAATFGSDFPVPPGEDVILGIEAIGPNHRISIDDRPLLDFEFDGPGGGAIGFIADEGATLVVERLEWTAGGAPTGSDDPEPPPTGGPLEWVRTGGPLGGLGYDVLMRPGDPDTMLVTDAFAGVFLSTDGGTSWAPSSDGITNSPITGMKTRKQPAMMPFFDNGMVTSQNALRREQPRSSAASSRLSSIRSSAE